LKCIYSTVILNLKILRVGLEFFVLVLWGRTIIIINIWFRVRDPYLFVCLFAWGLTALSAQIGYIMP